MSFVCKLGFHKWDGCTCARCGATRDEHHVYSTDCGTCSKCGKTHDKHHDWSKDCEKCARCGETRSDHHNWSVDCEKCSKCGKIRPNKHHFVNEICSICGQGTFVDERDGKTYKVVKIGKQIIMAENMAFEPEVGKFWAYEDTYVKISAFGYLYDWETAKTLAPKGWHLPTKEDWETLYQLLGNKASTVYEQAKVGGNSGFNGVLGGWRYARGEYNSLGASGYFWSATEEDQNNAAYFKLGAYKKLAEFGKGKIEVAMSVRLFRD
ncbi:MAG: hypothetical protein KKA07_15245 [Bacteroidetes bacterium]|nr:hypothetical protein [Bacteroidota bacterium]MBU1720417.1 hypothetical protein [Bacteroidota bacterium]